MNRRFILVLLAALLAAALLITAAAEGFAGGAVKRSEYKGNGVVEVDFMRDVRYENIHLEVTDESGAAVSAQLLEKDDDELEFRMEGFVQGATYNYAVSGVRAEKTGEALEVSGSIRVPLAGEIAIRKVEYDRDGEIEIEFSEKVEYRDVKVTVSSVLGGTFEAKITELDRDGIEAQVNGLEYGGIYTLKVSGVSAGGRDAGTDIIAEFIAVD